MQYKWQGFGFMLTNLLLGCPACKNGVLFIFETVEKMLSAAPVLLHSARIY